MLSAITLKAIKDSPWFWFAGLLLGAFLSGFGTYPALLSFLGRTHIDERELKELRASREALPRIQQQLALSNSESQSRVAALVQRLDKPSPSEQPDVKPPVQTFRGSGTSETNLVAIAPTSYRRMVRLTARAVSNAAVGGRMTIVVSGTERTCASGDFYRNPNQGPELSGAVECEEMLAPGQSRQYLARAPNINADGRTIDLQVVVSPQ
jgi:hypothetical protein